MLKMLRLISSPNIGRILTTNQDEGRIQRLQFVDSQKKDGNNTYSYGFSRIDLSGNPDCHFHRCWQRLFGKHEATYKIEECFLLLELSVPSVKSLDDMLPTVVSKNFYMLHFQFPLRDLQLKLI